jgi:hypothetical protein
MRVELLHRQHRGIHRQVKRVDARRYAILSFRAAVIESPGPNGRSGNKRNSNNSNRTTHGSLLGKPPIHVLLVTVS